VAAHGLPEYDALQLTQSRALAEFFEEAVAAGGAAKGVSNWMMGELARALKQSGRDISQSPIRPAQLADLLASSRTAPSAARSRRASSKRCSRRAGPPENRANRGLTQLDDEAEIVQSYRGGARRQRMPSMQYRAGKPPPSVSSSVR
jgi:aspartyl-tRNA(Asn)/glutamyl-tRNA(Gln) amidotransferase subunit B